MKAYSFTLYVACFLMLLVFAVYGKSPPPKFKLGRATKNGRQRLAQLPPDATKGAKGLLGKPKSANSDEIKDDDTASLEPGNCVEINENGTEVGNEDIATVGRRPRHKRDFLNAQFSKGSNAPIIEPRRNGRPQFTKQVLTHAFEGTNVTFEWLLADEDGNITQEDETDELKAGSLKLTMKMKGWQFCGRDKECVRNSTGTREIGVGTKCSFKIKPRKGRSTLVRKQSGKLARQQGKPDRFDIGSNGLAKFSFKAKIDNNWVTLNDSEITLSGTTVYVRFPMFNDTLEYDPTLEMGDDPADDESGADGVKIIPHLVVLTVIIGLYAEKILE